MRRDLGKMISGAKRPRSAGPMRAYASRAARLTRILMRSEEHTSELQSLMRISYAVFCLKKKTQLQNYSSSYTNIKYNITLLLHQYYYDSTITTMKQQKHKITN